MRHFLLLFVLLWYLPALLWSQQSIGARNMRSINANNNQDIGAHNNCNTSAAVTQFSCIITPTTGGSALHVEVEIPYSDSAIGVYVHDNVNVGNYLVSMPCHALSVNYVVCGFIKENVAATPTAVTVYETAVANSNTSISVQEVKGARHKFSLDGSISQQQDFDATNFPTSGPALMPYTNGEMIIGIAAQRTGSPEVSAGIGFSLIDNDTHLWPSYSAQTMAVPTNSPYVTTNSLRWVDGQVGIVPDDNSYCDSNIQIIPRYSEIPINGGNSLTLAVLAADTKNYPINPNANFSYTGGSSNAPGKWLINANNGNSDGGYGRLTNELNTFSPWRRTISCPGYTGNASEAAYQFSYTTPAQPISTGAAGASLFVENRSEVLSIATCIKWHSGTTPGSRDLQDWVSLMSDWGDFVNLYHSPFREQVGMEYGGGNTGLVSPPLIDGDEYWLQMFYVYHGYHEIKMYHAASGLCHDVLSTDTPWVDLMATNIKNGSYGYATRLNITNTTAQTTNPNQTYSNGAIKVSFYGDAMWP